VPQGRSVQVRKISPSTGIGSPDPPARSSVATPTELPGPLPRHVVLLSFIFAVGSVNLTVFVIERQYAIFDVVTSLVV
jgi:hypothetical protein